MVTLISRNILVTLRLMKEHRTRVAIHIRLNLKTATKRGGGYPKAWMHKMAEH